MRRGQSQQGLSMVELAITVAVTAIVAIPLAVIVRGVLDVTMHARESSTAMSLARYEMDWLDLLHHTASQLDIGSTTIANYQGTNYSLTRTITCTRGNNRCNSNGCGNNNRAAKRIEISVTGPGSGAPLAILRGLRSKCVSFGL